LSVYDCTSGSCTLAGSSANGDSEEAVTVADPAAGSWRVEIYAYSVPSGSTEYDYLDTYAVDGLGVVDVADEPAEHATGESWTAPATVTVTGQPGEGRVLRGVLRVRNDADLQVGSTEVLVESVTG